MKDTPFDAHAQRANEEGFYNQRVNTHSDIISEGIVKDLCRACPALKADLESGRVGFWTGVSDGVGRGRRADFLIAEPALGSGAVARPPAPYDHRGAALFAKPDLDRRRMFGEHKSIITAHRNKGNRHDDLNNLWQQTNRDPGIISFATIMVGTSERFLNVAQGVKPKFKVPVLERDELQFAKSGKVKTRFDKTGFAEVIRRIRKADSTLVRDYWDAVSGNGMNEWHKTVERCRSIPVRPAVDRTRPGYDAVVIVPVDYSNLRPASVNRQNGYGIDVDAEYAQFIGKLARLYQAIHGAGQPGLSFPGASSNINL